MSRAGVYAVERKIVNLSFNSYKGLTKMKEHFSASQINRVMSQSLDYECACPAQVCGAIVDLRDLYQYQSKCMRDSANDLLMHETIARATEHAHAVLENCLKEVLRIEGWDLETLELPEPMKAKALKAS
jgi:hypothetical protein